MGSTDKALITGFICRLCSKMNRFVIHIYGEEGERMKLAEKINAYLPITDQDDSSVRFTCQKHHLIPRNNYTEINANDQLPKTACLHCIDRLESHHKLMEQFIYSKKRLNTDNTSSSTSVVEASSNSGHSSC